MKTSQNIHLITSTSVCFASIKQQFHLDTAGGRVQLASSGIQPNCHSVMRADVVTSSCNSVNNEGRGGVRGGGRGGGVIDANNE